MKQQKVPSTIVKAEEIIIEDLTKSQDSILDFGCGDGHFTIRLLEKSPNVFGFDPDVERIRRAKKRTKRITFFATLPGKKLPYNRGTFDTVIMLGVLEHVSDEAETLKEIHRVLKPHGVLYIYGINKGLLGFLDAANLKFAFPSLHRILYKLFYNSEKYDKEFVMKEDGKMFGDFTTGKSWHTHYSSKDIDALTANMFVTVKHWYYGMFEPLLRVSEFVVNKVTNRKSNFMSRLIKLDSSVNWGNHSYCFVTKLCAIK